MELLDRTDKAIYIFRTNTHGYMTYLKSTAILVLVGSFFNGIKFDYPELSIWREKLL